MSVDYGVPLYTSGVFGKKSAQDDLGVEEVGAGLLRRLIPGVIQNTPNAGYYAFYPYLLWKWAQQDGDVRRDAFKPFYRRHEAAYAVACALHEHRDGITLNGVNGANAARQQVRDIEAGATDVDLSSLAAEYMDTPLGGYGLFYVAALQDARLVRAGERSLVDRATEHGAAVAEAFAKTYEQTQYYNRFFGADRVPVAVLRELGEETCLCTIPGRADHQLLLDTFFGHELPTPAWEDRRQRRVESLSLLLEFHAQRPEGAKDDLSAWRRALLDPRFSEGSPWETAHEERLQSWRAYQLREVQVLSLTTIWSTYVGLLGELGRATRAELISEMTSWLTAERLGFDPQLEVDAAMHDAQRMIPTAYELAEEVEPLRHEWRDERERAFCRAMRVVAVLPREISRHAAGFTELLDEGGSHRWSLRYLDTWLRGRGRDAFVVAASDLLEALHHQHVRVALSKVRVPSAQNLGLHKGNWRDPFNFAEDDGILRPLRPDEPFWTGARYGVGNHLLWALGLLTNPVPPTALTDLGQEYLKAYASA